MSKFNLPVYALSRYPVERLLPLGVAALTLLMMPESVWSWVAPWQLWSALCILGVGFSIMTRHRHPDSQQFSVDEQGIWVRTAVDDQPVDEHPYVIGHQSRVTALAIYLLLRPARGSAVHRWIFRSQCSERDYRRLSRMVSRMSPQAREKT